MSKFTNLCLLFVSSLFFITACQTQKVKAPEYLKNCLMPGDINVIDDKFQRFKYLVTGHFSNASFLAEHPEIQQPAYEVIIMPILEGRADGHWLYVEVFLKGFPEQPISQRINRIHRLSRDTFNFEVYYLNDPERYLNGWRTPKMFEGISIANETERTEACDILVAMEDDKKFEIVPPLTPSCPLDAPGPASAKYVYVKTRYEEEGHYSSVLYFDENRNLLNEPAESFLERLDYRKEDFHDYTKKTKVAQ